MKHEKIYLLTDGCMWEANKQNQTAYPHAIEVVDTETGAIRYIKSGSRIAFIEGQITEARSQETYNKMSANGQSVPERTRGKRTSKSNGATSV